MEQNTQRQEVGTSAEVNQYSDASSVRSQNHLTGIAARSDKNMLRAERGAESCITPPALPTSNASGAICTGIRYTLQLDTALRNAQNLSVALQGASSTSTESNRALRILASANNDPLVLINSAYRIETGRQLAGDLARHYRTTEISPSLSEAISKEQCVELDRAILRTFALLQTPDPAVLQELQLASRERRAEIRSFLLSSEGEEVIKKIGRHLNSDLLKCVNELTSEASISTTVAQLLQIAGQKGSLLSLISKILQISPEDRAQVVNQLLEELPQQMRRKYDHGQCSSIRQEILFSLAEGDSARAGASLLNGILKEEVSLLDALPLLHAFLSETQPADLLTSFQQLTGKKFTAELVLIFQNSREGALVLQNLLASPSDVLPVPLARALISGSPNEELHTFLANQERNQIDHLLHQVHQQIGITPDHWLFKNGSSQLSVQTELALLGSARSLEEIRPHLMATHALHELSYNNSSRSSASHDKEQERDRRQLEIISQHLNRLASLRRPLRDDEEFELGLLVRKKVRDNVRAAHKRFKEQQRLSIGAGLMSSAAASIAIFSILGATTSTLLIAGGSGFVAGITVYELLKVIGGPSAKKELRVVRNLKASRVRAQGKLLRHPISLFA